MENLLNLSYEELVDYLKEKYGTVPKDYFTKSGNKTSGITRSNEGLYIHHIDEDKMILLSNKIGNHPVINQGFLNEEQIKLIENDFQKKDRLVYCDLLEHLLLHLKILENPKPLIPNIEVGKGGVVNFIVPELNDIFSGIEYKQQWKKNIVAKIINRKEEYFKLLKYGIEILKLDFKKDYISTFPFNKMVGWDIKNNINLFKEMQEYFKKVD